MNILRLSGVINFETAQSYLKQVNDNIDADGDPLIIEMSAVTSCDSAGISVLIEAKKTAIKKGVLLKFVEIEKQVVDLAIFLKVDKLLFSE